MRNLFLIGLFCFISANIQAQDNPLNVETYQLSNGLTVYLNVDNTMPMVHGMVAVKGGAKRDPKDATGIAHYFEHILFKGTDEIGTINYTAEKVYLDSISNLYDDLGKTKDKEKRLEIQKEINRVSIKAADYAIPNELDKIINGMGGKNVNAGAGYESIVYYNSFPSNQIEKWLELYSHRFINPVFRLFQSELETVYEEKNLYADDPMDRMFEKFSAAFYKNSPYGQQTILGTTEDLKNPSLSKMAEYFKTYYVAKNMALVLSGDFDPEKIKPIISEKFGKWRSGEVPKDLALNESPFNGRELIKARLTPVKVGLLGFRTLPKNHPDELALELISNLLSNRSSTGLLDQLRTDNKLMFSGMMNDIHEELGGSFIFFVPKIVGQSLKKAEKEVARQLEKLRKGNFDDELLTAVKTEMKKQYETWVEDMRWRTYAISDAFLYGVKWEDYLNAPEKIDKITKADVVALSNKYFGDNYLVFYSKMGFPKKDKVGKPPYKPILPKNTDKKSEYAEKIEKMPVVEMEPKFIDFEKDVVCADIGNGVKAFITPNPINKIFSVRLVYGKGNYEDPIVSQAASMFDYASPEGMKYEDFKRQLQLLGCSFYAYSNLYSTTINISGLEEHLEASLKLMDQFLSKISVEEKQLKKLMQDYKMNLKFEDKDVNTKSNAITEYALYGNYSRYLSRLSVKEVKALTASELIAKMNDILNHQYVVHYCGTRNADDFVGIYKSSMIIPENLKAKSGVIEPKRTTYSQNTILFFDDKKAIQSHINFIVEGAINDEKSLIEMEGFNDYLGGSMSSIIFQEIREFRSLAYGSSGRYRPSFYRDKSGYFRGWLSTQADKTNEAIEVYCSLLKEMPQKPERIEEVRRNLTLSINASQPMLRYKSASVANWLEQGYQEDPRKSRYNDYLDMEFSEIMNFYNNNLKGKPWVIALVGDKSRIDMEALKKYGQVKIIEKGDLFKK
ncbi:MAG: insulinase family protein [Bacteroidales bacterium]|nr:insulinase family protein [Bacteroidales bacterium]